MKTFDSHCFKICSSVAIAAFTLSVTACQNETPTIQATDDTSTVSTNAIAKNDADNVDSSDTYITGTNQTTALPPFAEFKTALQGSWKRISYPYGTIEFSNDQIKLTPGEGAVEPAEFEDYKVSDTCPDNIDGDYSAQAYDFLVVANKRCNAIKINSNKLSFVFAGSNEATEYERMGEPTVAAVSALSTIPSNFYGTWANGVDNCAADNAKQLQISSNKLSFSTGDATLIDITQFEPTRLEANFDYMSATGESKPYFYTLDLKDQQKVLIMRKNGDNARTGPIQYNKCV